MPSPTSADLRWQALLGDFRRGGLTHTEFCRHRGISVHTFRKRLYGQKAIAPADRRKESDSGPTRFLPVTVAPANPIEPAGPSDPLALILAGGRRIAVGRGFDPETLRRLIDLLEARP